MHRNFNSRLFAAAILARAMPGLAIAALLLFGLGGAGRADTLPNGGFYVNGTIPVGLLKAAIGGYGYNTQGSSFGRLSVSHPLTATANGVFGGYVGKLAFDALNPHLMTVEAVGYWTVGGKVAAMAIAHAKLLDNAPDKCGYTIDNLYTGARLATSGVDINGNIVLKAMTSGYINEQLPTASPTASIDAERYIASVLLIERFATRL